jgi:hypothetical protein
MRQVLAALALAGLAAPAFACGNDKELPHYEKEFRSQYADGKSSPPESSNQYLPVAAGGALLLSTGVVTRLIRNG